MYGPLASKSRDSPASPGRKSTASTYTGWGGNPFDALKCGSFRVSFDQGMTTLTAQLEAGRIPLAISGVVSRVSLVSGGTVCARSAVRPRSSAGCTSSRSWVMKGRLASIIGPVDFTPGMRALARCGNGPAAQFGTCGPEQNAAFSAWKAGVAAARVFGSSATALESATFLTAKECAVVLKSVIRFWSVRGWVSIAPDTSPCSAIQFERSCGWIPSASWATTAEYS